VQNKRKDRRPRMRRYAEVITAPREQSVSCVVWDISRGGARLAIARPIMTLPPRLLLQLDNDGRVQRKCEVVRTDAGFVGVRFG
jgi:hypothetical protein